LRPFLRLYARFLAFVLSVPIRVLLARITGPGALSLISLIASMSAREKRILEPIR